VSERLDYLVARLATAAPDRSLDGFEAEIGRGIGRWRVEGRIAAALRSVRLASIGLALVIGITAGGLAVIGIGSAKSSGLFGPGAALAPSTLLEGAP
jgi:hypothetical protein